MTKYNRQFEERSMAVRERTLVKVEKMAEIRADERVRCLEAVRQIWIDRPDASDQYNIGFGEALAAACAAIRSAIPSNLAAKPPEPILVNFEKACDVYWNTDGNSSDSLRAVLLSIPGVVLE